MFAHGYPFDPTYGYTLDALRKVEAPQPPEDFAAFWSDRYQRAMTVRPQPEIHPVAWEHPRYRVFDLRFRSTDGIAIGGWALLPREREIRRGLVFGHGYGGIDGPDFDLPFDNAAMLFPCFRGISRSRCAEIPEAPYQHVLCGIDHPRHYVIGGCVDDLWLAVSALRELFPAVDERIGFLGISFGGGIGALALPWDPRIGRAHLNVPTFGHHPLRLSLPTVGSGEALRQYQSSHGHIMDTLQYYDAAVAARFAQVPVHVAAARFDPVVAPPGQFAVFNGLAGPKELFVLDAGHFDYPGKREQDQDLSVAVSAFFAAL